MSRLLIAPIRAGCVLLSVASLIACHAGSAARPRPVAPSAADVDVHVVRSEELRAIMQQMELLMYDRIQPELELDKQRQRRATEITVTASELAAAANEISGVPPYGTLDDEAQQRFDVFAFELKRDAIELARLARARRFVASAAQFDRLSHTCDGCHSIYRGREGLR